MSESTLHRPGTGPVATSATSATGTPTEQLWLSTTDHADARRQREFWRVAEAIERAYWELLAERGDR